MARLRDIKVGMTVWIKEGKTHFKQFAADQMKQHIGECSTVEWVNSSTNGIGVFGWTWPADWISFTPPKGAPSLKGVASNEASKETPVKDTPKQKLYVAVSGCEVTEPGTLEQVVNFLQDVWNYTEDEIVTTKIYELTEVKIKYTPAKYEVVER